MPYLGRDRLQSQMVPEPAGEASRQQQLPYCCKGLLKTGGYGSLVLNSVGGAHVCALKGERDAS